MQHSADPAVACTVCGSFNCDAEQARIHATLARHGNEFDAAYREYWGTLLAFAKNTARKARASDVDVDCEGVVQDAFLALLAGWSKVEEPHAYLFGVVRNLVRQGVRSSSRRWGHSLSEVQDQVNVWWTSQVLQPPVPKVVAVRRVFEVLSELTEKQRVATYLSHVEGMSHPEIAALLKCDPKTIAVHVHRAVKKLRDDPFVVAAPGRDLDREPDRKPEQQRRIRLYLGWPRRLARRVAGELLLLARRSFVWLVQVPQSLSRRIGLLYPNLAIRALHAHEPTLPSDSAAFVAFRLAGPVLITQAKLLAPRWLTQIPGVPQCATCAAGWLRSDGTYGCWCCRYRANVRPGVRVRVHSALRRAAARSQPARRPARHQMLLDRTRTELAALPRYQQPFYTGAVLSLLLKEGRTCRPPKRRRDRTPQEPTWTPPG
ncbi:Uncharacterised protein [Amycolatopsis camponoti]|uniref:RNA polymerase sigma factor 70 region 4 type 2 domain-containing protein n=1 Tax=Amycolatopsis camponoti TaxID=2606593 RepID=A0A6I8M1T5_9PSEU|nr:sigma-70 family RNA polymerase sigma factor [Amycolatopsis camponoti]VVJ22602.1 Uncharacterised protein [Amycolatopsis camponoti]